MLPLTDSQKKYAEYLQSPHWKQLSAAVKARAGYRCQVCDSPHDLQAHHRKYDNRGKESLDDLICLCRRCHAVFHGQEPPSGLKTPVLGNSAQTQTKKERRNEKMRMAIEQTQEVLADMPEGTGDIMVTKELVDLCMTKAGGFTNETLRHLGVTAPLIKGWRFGLVGKIISREKYQAALAGRYMMRTGPLPNPED